jgi:hypothetical protein
VTGAPHARAEAENSAHAVRSGYSASMTGRPLCARALAVLVLAMSASGCATPLTPGQRAREAAHDYAMAVRFGRMDMAREAVGPSARAAFTAQHATWGNAVRIVDCELVGMTVRDKDRADVLLNVSWQRVDETDMRVTQIAQHWRDQHGGWLLDSEERAAGDVGLLGERTVVVGAPRTGNVQYESIRIP